MLTILAAFPEGSPAATLGDVGSLIITVAAVAGVVWAAVVRGTRPIRDRLDEIRDIAEALRQERERVDDLSDRVSQIDRRLGVIERRVEDLYHLLLSIIDPRRLRQTPPHDDDTPTG